MFPSTLTRVCLAIVPFCGLFAVEPFLSYPPRHTGGSWQVFDGWFALLWGMRLLQLLFFAFFWLYSHIV